MKGCLIGMTLIIVLAQVEPMLEKNQKKQNNKKAQGLHNMIDKHGKKESGDVDEVITQPPETTPKEVKSLTDFDAQLHDISDDKIRKIIELTVVSCCITVAIVVLVLSIRLAYLICKNCRRNYDNRSERRARRRRGMADEVPSVHFSTSISNVGPNNVTTSPITRMNPSGPASIYTVMPGHFVLQPCYPSSSSTGTAPPTSSHGVTTSARLPGEPLQVVTSYRVRPETPPPPYPGPKLEGEEGKL